jgi:hypothetical protein
MGTEYEITIEAHPSIYDSSNKKRHLHVLFTEPSQGINSHTGLLLVIAGYGEQSSSESYRLARGKMADEHNVIVVQCDYFGHEFMQESQSVQYEIPQESLRTVFTDDEMSWITPNGGLDMERFFEVGIRYPIRVEGIEQLQETVDNFNDMGVMQALDQLTAIFAVQAILIDNGYKINRSRVYAYGKTDTAYLIYICNALAPSLFSCIIDNSGWLFPMYLESDRLLSSQIGKLLRIIRFDYMVKKISHDKELLQIPWLYKQFLNQAQVICYHGADDDVVLPKMKQAFCQSMQGANCRVITKESINKLIFQSSSSGLGANYFDFFSFALKEHIEKKPTHEPFEFIPTLIETKSYRYKLEFSTGMPTISRVAKRPFSKELVNK